MVKIAPFQVELWMDNYETTARYNIAETCAASISIDDLLDLSEDRQTSATKLSSSSLKLVYGAVRGTDELRNNLAGLYSARATAGSLSKDEVIITGGAISANYLVLYSLVEPGDHVICHYPTYEQLYQVPASFGADVSLWKTDPASKWQLEAERLSSLVQPHTKMIILNNPNNPSGSIIPQGKLLEIVDFAKDRGIIVLIDEVYRPLFHSIKPADEDFPSSGLNLGYDKVIVTGSMSKAYSLAGIRTGWIACRNREIIEKCADARHYTTLSVSKLDEAVAAEALSDRCIHALLGRNIRLAQTNLALLEAFIDEHKWSCSWVKPIAGSTAMVRFAKMGKPVDDEVFCKSVLDKAGVFFCPGSKCFGGGADFKGYVRIGFVCETSVLKEGLAALKTFMEDEFENIPVAPK